MISKRSNISVYIVFYLTKYLLVIFFTPKVNKKMEIVFRNSKLKKQCNSSAGKLKNRLDDIRACGNMEIMKLLPGRLHPLKENRKGQWAMDLEHPKRLIMEPIADPLPVSKDGWLDLSKISIIKIIEIGDYHGK